MHFQKAYDKANDNANNCDNLGLAFYHLHDLEQALRYFDKAIELDSNMALSHFHRGLVFLDNKDFGKAENCLNTAITLDPNNEIFYHTKGQVYERQELPELYDNAIEQFKKAISINDMHTQSYFHLGRIYHLKKLFDEALMCYNKVIELETSKEEVKVLVIYRFILRRGEFC